jgi:hypothetical protein
MAFNLSVEQHLVSLLTTDNGKVVGLEGIPALSLSLLLPVCFPQLMMPLLF